MMSIVVIIIIVSFLFGVECLVYHRRRGQCHPPATSVRFQLNMATNQKSTTGGGAGGVYERYKKIKEDSYIHSVGAGAIRW